jgi:hypothetical protein
MTVLYVFVRKLILLYSRAIIYVYVLAVANRWVELPIPVRYVAVRSDHSKLSKQPTDLPYLCL